MSHLLLHNQEIYSKEDKEKCLPTIYRLIDLAEMARREGVLAMEASMTDEPDPMLKIGIHLIVDGTAPEVVERILQNIIAAEAYKGYDKLKSLLIMSGVLMIQAGENPNLIVMSLASMLGIEYIEKLGDGLTGLTSKEHFLLMLDGFKEQLSIVESAPFEKTFNALGNRDIQIILRETDKNDLTRALQTCGYETVERFLCNLSHRLGAVIMGVMKGIPADREMSLACQKKILAVYEWLASVGGEVTTENGYNRF
jgi:hypothetical protein